ncbi:hypothetical protein CF328_g7917 [Tilletia controversa]|nr:hypothetical protein CF328_g7917 [Tilletia controversa]
MRKERRQRLREQAATAKKAAAAATAAAAAAAETAAPSTETVTKAAYTGVQPESRLDRRPCGPKRKMLRLRSRRGQPNDRRHTALKELRGKRIEAQQKALRAAQREEKKQARLLANKFVEAEAAVEAPDGSEVRIKPRLRRPQKQHLEGFVVSDNEVGPSVNRRAAYTKSLS